MKTFITSVFLFMAAVFPLIGQIGKAVPYEYYPSEYKSFESKDWNKIKSILDSTLKFKDVKDLRQVEAHRAAWFILSRIADIQWNGQRQEVSNYLLNYLNLLISGTSFIKDFRGINPADRDLASSDPVFLPHKTVWTLIRIDEGKACEAVRSLQPVFKANSSVAYFNHLQRMTLLFVEQRFQSDVLFSCLKDLEANKKESGQISKVLLKHSLYKTGDQSKAWDLLWENYKTDTVSVLLSDQYRGIWYNNILMMKDVYPDLNLPALIDLSEGSADYHKKYTLLYAASFVANMKLGSASSNVSPKDVERLSKSVERFYKGHSKEVAREDTNRDYLKSAFESVKQKKNHK